tara:strand:- start:1354 stop:2409 length:1056 start_codon:yes stop_codon:yes gene_type:complete
MPTTYAIPNGRTVMGAFTYTGNGSASSNTTQNITTPFYPDMAWVKGRSGSDSTFYHRLTSTGLTQPNYLAPNATDAESSGQDQISALASTYFQVKASGSGGTNQSGSTYVGWAWNANSGTTVSNASGSITSSVSANTTAGFSVVTYTGTGANATVGHGLGVAPKFIITKKRSSTSNWATNDPSQSNPWSGALLLNSTNAFTSSSAVWNDTAPTTTVFSIGTADAVNISSATYVAYCFAPVAGYSAFGSYTGNGSADGPFVYLGFRPRFVMIKGSSDADRAWVMIDTSRNTANVMNLNLYANASDAEATDTRADGLSNGFKVRGTGTWVNNSASTYIYMAFAENPFKYANAR